MQKYPNNHYVNITTAAFNSREMQEMQVNLWIVNSRNQTLRQAA